MEKVKASVQYNDFIGTAAADIADGGFDLSAFLKSRKVNTDRYSPFGASFYHGYADSFHASILCVDKEQSTDENEFITEISISDVTHEEFFDLFKRFKVVIHNKYGNYDEREINHTIYLEDGLEENED